MMKTILRDVNNLLLTNTMEGVIKKYLKELNEMTCSTQTLRNISEKIFFLEKLFFEIRFSRMLVRA